MNQSATENSGSEKSDIYRVMFENTQSVKLLIDPDGGRIIDANTAAALFYGYPREELLQMAIQDINILPANQILELMTRSLIEKSAHFHFRHRLASGEIRDVEVYSDIFEINGKILLHSLVHDITERTSLNRLLELKNNQLIESEERFRKIFEQSSVGLALIQKDGMFLTTNEAFCTMMEYCEEEITDIPFTRLLHPDTLTEDLAAVQDIIAGKMEVYIREKRYITKTGRETWAKANISLIRDSFGKALYMLALVEDINARKKAELALKESEANLRALNATKDRFFSIIAHDLKSPLNGILGLSALLRDDAADMDIGNILQYAGMIQVSAQQTYDLLENLLGWARMQQGQFSFKPSRFSIHDMIMNVTGELMNNIRQKAIELSIEIPEFVVLDADENMTRMVIRNLVANAVKFTPRKGRINIRVQAKPEHILIAVADNGVGMRKETIDNLFRIETSFSTRGTENEKGTGLGLLLCKEFMDKHEGRIEVSSLPGLGSTFTVVFPVKD